MRPAQSNSPQRVKFEELFFAHHARLLAWALQLARGNRWEADDLVQELFVQFARSSPDLDQIRRPEDYLFSVLRNLQYARLRRAGRSAIDDLSIVDYDSIAQLRHAAGQRKLHLFAGNAGSGWIG
jgi:DNA-directed RNA polymerase specialized sigma24 family protein